MAVDTSPQRATVVLEHSSASDDAEEEAGDAKWCVVAYLVYDSGSRDRATLCRCQTRAEAAHALEEIWQGLTK
jgi:hypothetical protein